MRTPAFVSLAAFSLSLSCGVARAQAPASATPPPAAPPTKDATPPVRPGAGAAFESAQGTEVASGFRFTEGPTWWSGRFLFCDMAASTMYTIDPGTPGAKAEEFRKPSDKAVGATLDRDGRLVVCHFAGKVTRTEADGKVATIAEKVDGKKLARPNDLAVRSDGSIYFSDFGAGPDSSRGLFRIAPDGKVTLLDKDYQAPNGVVFSPDEKTLYVADYAGKTVISYAVAADGTLSGRRTFIDFTPDKAGGNPDGMRVDTAGNLYTTGPGGIWVYQADGQAMAFLPLIGATNMAFGGSDGRTLFITAGSKVMTIRTKIAGVVPGKASAK